MNKANLLIKIGELVREKQIDGISDLRDESDKSGMRVVIELKRGENADVILNNLYKHTQMQDTFGMNMVALVDGQPRLLNLKEMLDAFLRHRREVVTRRTVFDLRKARERGHILEGLAVALANVDEIIALIKASETPADRQGAACWPRLASALVEEMLARIDPEFSRPVDSAPQFGLHADGYHLSEIQAQRILEMQLQRLTDLEQDKIIGEYKEIMEKHRRPARHPRQPGAHHRRSSARNWPRCKSQFGDKRRSVIVENAQDMSMEDLIAPEDMVVTLSHARLHEVAAARRLPRAEARRARQAGGGHQGRRLHRAACSSPTPTTTSCASPTAVGSTGSRSTTCRRAGAPRAASPSSTCCRWKKARRSTRSCRSRPSTTTTTCSWRPANGIVKKTPLSDFSRPRTRRHHRGGAGRRRLT